MKKANWFVIAMAVFALFFSAILQQLLSDLLSDKLKPIIDNFPLSWLAFLLLSGLTFFILSFILEKLLQGMQMLPNPANKYCGKWFCDYTDSNDDITCSLIIFGYSSFFKSYNLEIIDYILNGKTLIEKKDGKHSCQKELFAKKGDFQTIRCNMNVNTRACTFVDLQITNADNHKKVVRGQIHRFTDYGCLTPCDGTIAIISEEDQKTILRKSKIEKVISNEECIKLAHNYYKKSVKEKTKAPNPLKSNNPPIQTPPKLKSAQNLIRVIFIWENSRLEAEIDDNITATTAINELVAGGFVPDKPTDTYILRVEDGYEFSGKMTFSMCGAKNGSFIHISNNDPNSLPRRNNHERAIDSRQSY